MKDNIPMMDGPEGKEIQAFNRQGEQVVLKVDEKTISRTNPVTGEVTFVKDNERYKVGYKPRKEFETKHIPPYRAMHENNKDEADKGQKLRRYLSFISKFYN